MASHEPPKFKPFTKTKVALALEATPLPIDQNTDLTAFVPQPFRAPVTDDSVSSMAVPTMFGRKKKSAATSETTSAATDKPIEPSAFPGLTGKRAKTRQVPPATGKVYSRVDVLSREVQAAEVEKLPLDLQEKAKGLLDIETTNPYEIEPPSDAFIPLTRNGFGSFLLDQYGPIFPKASQRALDVATCAAKGDEGTKEVKIYHYQAFIREYLRYESPYRGLLVYHGLGSGKTCSAIAAAEALFGARGMKIVVMTPFSLRDNFIGEISFCGFKHFRLQNHWTSLSLAEGSTPEPGMVKLFAQNVYGIPESYFAKKGRGRAQLSRIWIPDFEQKPNFDSLKPEERDEISTQLKATIENRIKFINYNGITARELKTMVCSTPDVFDNAVIVVDEIHNLTRLIQGSLEVYLGTRTTRGATVAKEFLTPERKKLPLCGMAKAYMRGYLFYRLFMDAKNTKVIGLSGTPLINFPEELGIMMNIIHGPIQTMEFTVTVEGSRDVRTNIETAVKLNENLDTVFFQAAEGTMSVTVTRLPEQFTKVLSDDSEVLGIRRRDPLKAAAVPTLEEVWTELQTALKADGIKIMGTGTRAVKELLPSWDTPFRGAFLQEDGITLKNTRVLQKRIRGLVSYYRGIQGNVMPKVAKDEVIGVPLTGYSLKIYNKLRNQEIQIEMSKPKDQATGGDAIWAEIGEIASMKTSSNYRMSSRQACNFVFPEGVSRPRPRNLEEQDAETGTDRDLIVDADIEEQAPGRDADVARSEEAAEAEDITVKAEATGTSGAISGTTGTAVVLGTKEQTAAYKQAIKSAKDKLRLMGPTHLQIDSPSENKLSKYSPKFAAMLTKINSLPGSSLVYSQFLEMEGIGIFGICMEANGYVPIEIVDGADGKLRFSERTATSLLKGPKVPENRYIEFTGTGTKEQRGAAVNVFNARLDKVSPAIQKVLKDGGWTNNLDGGLCRVFCITSAGAEGLSLKTVRGVHIMEPYWNTARTQQVKGRAVRICSHMDLPVDQQNVEIYTYCTMIPEEALLAQAVDKTLERSDTYSAKEAAALGVPVPAPVAAGIDTEALTGMFFKVDAEKVETGAETVDSMGPIKFYSKLDNEYRGFSNFAPSPMTIGGKRYTTVEHYFQSSKFPSDLAWQEAIRVAPTPLKAKQLGTQTDHVLRPDWDTVKEGIMLEGLRAKFQQNRGLLEQLKATGDRPLVEASVDAFWGEGRTGKGKNRLGKLLEQVRTELKEYVVPPSIPEAPVQKEDFFKTDEEIPEESVTEVVAPEALVPEVPMTPVVSVAPVAPVAPLVSQAPVVPVAPLVSQVPEVPVAPVAPEVPEEELPVKQTGGDGDDRVIILTSDQKVLLISLRKERVIGSLQTLMKTVAVDCQLNFPDNNDGSFRCMSLGDSVNDFAYHPDLQKDIQETEARFRVQPPPIVPVAPIVTTTGPPKPKPKRIVYRKKEYYYQVKIGADGKPAGYLFFEMTDPDNEKPVGFVVADPITKMPKGDIGPVPS
jgi:ribA/ribD-fused uncharacterized protein